MSESGNLWVPLTGKRAKTFISLSDKENTWYTDGGNGAGRVSGSAAAATLMAMLAAPAAALAQRALFAQ